MNEEVVFGSDVVGTGGCYQLRDNIMVNVGLSVAGRQFISYMLMDRQIRQSSRI